MLGLIHVSYNNVNTNNTVYLNPLSIETETKNKMKTAINNGNIKQLITLGDIFKHKCHNYQLMVECYKHAIKKGSINAMHKLGDYYRDMKQYNNMEACYKMAVNKNNNKALQKLGNYYYTIDHDIDKAREYYEKYMSNGGNENTLKMNELEKYEYFLYSIRNRSRTP